MPIAKRFEASKKKERFEKEYDFVSMKLYPSNTIAEDDVSDNVHKNTYEKIRFEINEQIEVPSFDNPKEMVKINDGINCWFKPAIKYEDLPAPIMNLYSKTEGEEIVKMKAKYYFSYLPDKTNPEKTIALKRTTMNDLKDWVLVSSKVGEQRKEDGGTLNPPVDIIKA